MSDSNRRARSDSAQKAVEVFQSASEVIPVPQGFRCDHPAFAEAWNDYIRARAREDWKKKDLRQLQHLCRVETEIFDLETRLKAEGDVVVNARGTQIANPVLNVLTMRYQQFFTLTRLLSLNTTDSDPRTVGKAAQKEQEAAKVLADKAEDSLLAMPN